MATSTGLGASGSLADPVTTRPAGVRSTEASVPFGVPDPHLGGGLGRSHGLGKGSGGIAVALPLVATMSMQMHVNTRRIFLLSRFTSTSGCYSWTVFESRSAFDHWHERVTD
jgi:hypothetical protein